MRPVRLTVVFAALAACAQGAMAADSHPCAATLDPAERLACYDRAFPPAPDARDASGLSEAERAARREQAVKDFGLNRGEIEERKPEAEREFHPDSVEGTVAKISYRSTGERVVTLDNGQVWMIIEVTEKGFIKAGSHVSIKTGMLPNTYMLDTGRINLRARRLQ
jgi:hypothetical protein